MEKVNFIEIAKYCQEQSQIKHSTPRNSYCNTLFVSIQKDNKIECSCTPHILAEAKQCILIHAYDVIPAENPYVHFDIDYIDEKGCVSQNRLDDNFRLDVDYIGPWRNHVLVMRLRSDDYSTTFFTCTAPWQDKKIEVIWNLYLKIRDCSLQEAKMVASLAMKDNKIALQAKKIKELEATKLYLEQEVAVYKSILDEIKSLLKNNATIKK